MAVSKSTRKQLPLAVKPATAGAPRQVKRGWVRVLLFSLFSFGLYTIYWFYVTRRAVFREQGKASSAGLHTLGLFVPILQFFIYYWLVKDIAELSQKAGAKEVSVPLLFLLWVFVGIIGLILTQVAFNDYWDKKLGQNAADIPVKAIEILTVVVAALFWTAFFVLMFVIVIFAVNNAAHLNKASDYLNQAATDLTVRTTPNGLPSTQTVGVVQSKISQARSEIQQYDGGSVIDDNYRRALLAEVDALDNYLQTYREIYADSTITTDELARFQLALSALNKADTDRQSAENRVKNSSNNSGFDY